MRLPRCYVMLVQNVDCVETVESKRQTEAVALMLFSDEIFFSFFFFTPVGISGNVLTCGLL